MNKFYGLFFFLMGFTQLFAQAPFEPEMRRALFHNKLDKAQKALLAMDGTADNMVKVFEDEELNLQLTYQAITHIDHVQEQIERDSSLSNNQKITFVRGFEELLNEVSSSLSHREFRWIMLPQLVDGYEVAIKMQLKGLSLRPVLASMPYYAASILANNFSFESNSTIDADKEYLLIKFIEENPSKLLWEMAKRPNLSFIDSLIVVAAQRAPEELVTYAQARQTPLGIKIAANTDSRVKMIVELSGDVKGQLYFPFLDKMLNGQITRNDITDAIADSSKYYSLLVKTQIEYSARMATGDTPVVVKGIQQMLEIKSREIYVNTINGLHELAAPIRFKIIQSLTPQELYYLMVMNEMEIYTSSYIYVYQRMFEVMPVKSSDSLLKMINYDKYKKFITMASNYNLLDNFLSKMSPENATALMTSFVNNLDRTQNLNDIEDAVDVANAYSSIKNPGIRDLMLSQVEQNLEEALANSNVRGTIIYQLEKKIMESADSTKKIDLSKDLGILPVFEVKNNFMRDSLGRIILQMFFLDDGTGKGSFNKIVNLFGDKSKWKINNTPDWVQFTSINTPVPFMIFANRALDGQNDLDEEAQWKLTRFLVDSGYNPSIIVHRGHSYSLKSTIEKMQPTSKIVVLGSCGAYHNLDDILKISPEAYIIGSKQTGMGAINVPIFSYLIEQLKMGRDIQWPAMKLTVGSNLVTGVSKEDYEDYIFPHQNLGALFIKAYKKAMNNYDESGANGMSIL